MYSTDGGKTWHKDKIEIVVDYMLETGWKMTQPEFATKGNLRVELDFYPPDISNGKECRKFYNLKSFKKILNDETFVQNV